MDPNLQVYESEARAGEKPDLGPVCYDCGKPTRLDGRKTRGGCECEARPIREGQITQATTTADRNVMAMERIAACLVALCKHHKLEVAEPAPLSAIGPMPITGTPVDALRQKAKVG